MSESVRLIDIHAHSPNTSEDVLTLLNIQPDELPGEGQYFTAGIHPWKIRADNWVSQMDWLRSMAGHPGLLGIGECGIDKLQADPELQFKVFEQQALFSLQINKPLVLHAVRSQNQIIALKRKLKPTKAWIVHGFRSRPEIARQFIDNGFHLSFGVALMSANAAALESFNLCPADRLFLETDDQGGIIQALYAHAAMLKSMEVKQLATIIWNNFVDCFGWEKQ
jgi:TatD DNase family protein